MDAKTKKDLVQGVLGIGGGFLLFWLLMKAFNKKDEEPEVKQIAITAQNVDTAITSYRNAINEGESADALADLNKLLIKEFGVTVGFNALQQQYTVYDVSGKVIKTV